MPTERAFDVSLLNEEPAKAFQTVGMEGIRNP